MTESQIQECLEYAESLIESKLQQAIPRHGGGMFSRALGGRRVFWLEDPTRQPRRNPSMASQVDFIGYFTRRNRGTISYGNTNESWDSTSETPLGPQFSVVFNTSGQGRIINNLFGDQSALYQDYTQTEPEPVQGFNKVDLKFTFNPVELSFPVRVYFKMQTTTDSGVINEEVSALFNSSSPQTLDFSLPFFGSRIITLDRIIKV